MGPLAAPAAPGARKATRTWLVALVACALALVTTLSSCRTGPAPEQPHTVDRAAVAAAVDDFIGQSLSPGMRNLRALVVSVDGEVVLERYPGSARRETAAVASVTKSVVSTLVGIAEAEGLLSLGDTLAESLPSYAGQMSEEVASITVRELLTMTAGLPADEAVENPRAPLPAGRDWVAAILEQGTVQPPGRGFAYSSAGSHLLAAILVEATGRPLLDYAREKLFDPLGIRTRPAFQPRLGSGPPPQRAYARAGFAWPRDPQGINIGAGDLKLSAPDLVKLGRLYADLGVRQGERVVPATWVRDATGAQVATGRGPAAHYGYQWWVTSAGGHEAYAAIGSGGQVVEVVPDLDLVVVASVWIEDTVSMDSTTWLMLVDLAVVPAVEGTGGP